MSREILEKAFAELEQARAEITRYRAMLRVVREHLAKHSSDERSALVVAIDETLRGKT